MDGPVSPVAPAVGTTSAANGDGVEPVGEQKQIVKGWAAEFKLEGLWGDGAADYVDSMQT